MSKGGSETQTTELPDWLKGPAIRNLQRAEDVQRIPYMPYRGPDVAGFNPTQQAAMGTNIDTARAFGLLGDNYLNLTPLSGMPEPTEFAGGWSGYSSMPLYDQALAETKAKQPEAWEQYQALYGANVPTQRDAPPSNGGGGGAGGGANDGWAGGNVMGHTAYASAGDAMAAGDYWSAYRQDHQQWRDGQGIWAGKGKQPGQSDLHYPGNPALGIRSDANQLIAMGMGDKITPDIAPATSVKISPSVSLTPPSVNTTTTDVPIKATKPWTPPVASPKPVVTVTPPPAKTTTTDVPIKATKPFTLTSKPTVTASKPTVTFSEKKAETKKAVSAYNAGGGMNIPAPAPAPSSRAGTPRNYGVTGRLVSGGR